MGSRRPQLRLSLGARGGTECAATSAMAYPSLAEGWRPRNAPHRWFSDVVGELEAQITLDGRRADEYLLYPRWERRIGSERVVYREDRDRPLSPRGMHEWFAKRLQEADVDHFHA